MKRTASAFVINDEEELLCIYHEKFGKWVQPGGHIEGLEMPSETAIREVWEETQIPIQLLSEEAVFITEYHNNVGEQMDYQFLAYPLHENIHHNKESKKAAFLSREQIHTYPTVDDLEDVYTKMLTLKKEGFYRG